MRRCDVADERLRRVKLVDELCSPTGGPGAGGRSPFPQSVRAGGRAGHPARPGRRHGGRRPGIWHVARGRDWRLAAVRRDLGLDEGQSPAARRSDLVSVAQWSGARPAGCIRRRLGCQPRAVGGRLPLPASSPQAGGTSAGERDHACRGRLVRGAPRAHCRPLGGHPADHDQPELLLARDVHGVFHTVHPT